MQRKYRLLEPRFEHPVGTVAYAYSGCTYGLVSDDGRMTGRKHIALTLSAEGRHPFFTAEVAQIEEVRDGNTAQVG